MMDENDNDEICSLQPEATPTEPDESIDRFLNATVAVGVATSISTLPLV